MHQDTDGGSMRMIFGYIRNVFRESKLDEQVVVRKFRTTTRYGAIPNKTQPDSNVHIESIFTIGELVEATAMKKFGIPEFQKEAHNCRNLGVLISDGDRGDFLPKEIIE